MTMMKKTKQKMVTKMTTALMVNIITMEAMINIMIEMIKVML